jgi:hypothetical protein
MVAVIDRQLGHAAMAAAAECPSLDFELSERVIGAYDLPASELPVCHLNAMLRPEPIPSTS